MMRSAAPLLGPLLLLLTTWECTGLIPSAWIASHRSTKKLNKSFRLFSSDISVDESTKTTPVSSDDWVKKEIESQHIQPYDALNIDHHCVKGPQNVLVYDTTLRDGTQMESVSASCEDKLKITRKLAAFGADYIEAGWPGSNPKDAEFFDRAKKELTEQERSKLVAFGSTRRKGISVEDDPQIQALVESEAPTVCLVAKAHLWQVTDILRATPEENIEMIRDSVSYLTSLGKRVFVDLEHFYDGYAHDSEYTLKCCEAAVDAGTKCLVLCDTNGGSMPWEVEDRTKHVVKHFDGFDVSVGVHAHNDCGMAVANSMTACNAGAGLVQGTINGIGERTGNADLCSIVPSLALHVESNLSCRPQLSDITSVSRFVDEILNRTPHHAAPYVGASAFAHKGGLHVAAMERSPLSYQHVEPTDVGNEKRVLVSELSGRQNIMGKMVEAGFDLEHASERATAILNRVKTLESKGYTFEGAEASVHLMILHGTRGYCPPFRVLDYSAQVYDANIDSATRVLDLDKRMKDVGEEEKGSYNTLEKMSGPTARATIKVRTLNLDEHYDSLDVPLMYKDRLEVSDGSGPVDALASALKQALVPSHPYLDNLELVDYKVRILDPESATGAATRVMIEFRDSETDATWTTVSVDRNVISASLNALVDGFEYALIEHASSCVLCEDIY